MPANTHTHTTVKSSLSDSVGSFYLLSYLLSVYILKLTAIIIPRVICESVFLDEKQPFFFSIPVCVRVCVCVCVCVCWDGVYADVGVGVIGKEESRNGSGRGGGEEGGGEGEALGWQWQNENYLIISLSSLSCVPPRRHIPSHVRIYAKLDYQGLWLVREKKKGSHKHPIRVSGWQIPSSQGKNCKWRCSKL